MFSWQICVLDISLLALIRIERVELQKGGRCLRVRYYSRECQRRDWRDHRRVCGTASGGVFLSVLSISALAWKSKLKLP